jgi:phosphate transport system protein
VRTQFTAELDQLRLQVELMAVRVDHNLERMREVLSTGDDALAARARTADDDIDAMNVSLTERCYDLLRRQAPVASDLRFVVSVLRVLAELERVGDLALRVVNAGVEHELLVSEPVVFDVLQAMADQTVDRFRTALRAWAAMDLGVATDVATGSRTLDVFFERLLAEVVRLEGPDAVRVALTAVAAGRALERISDHSAILGARTRYLLTGDPDHLAAEVR